MRRQVLHTLLALSIFNVAVTSAQSDIPPLSDNDQAELQKFISKFPGIVETLGPDPCQWCGCLNIFCRADEEGNTSHVESLELERRDAPGNDDEGLGDGGCRPYTDCPLEAFEVTLTQEDWPNLPQLTAFRMVNYSGSSVERLKGGLPEQLPELMPSLEFLQIVGTGLSGTVPASWFQRRIWQRMRSLDLRANIALEGQLPDIAPYALGDLLTLRINDAPIGGTIPNVGPRPTKTEFEQSGITFDFASLGLTGTLPPDFAPGGQVGELQLENNALTGTLPPEWAEEGHFGFLISLSLANNSLTGTIPSNWGMGIYTPTGDNGGVSMHLEGNNLTGPIPPGFAASGRTYGSSIYVSPGNSFCGPVPNNTLAFVAFGTSEFGPDDERVNATLPACPVQ